MATHPSPPPRVVVADDSGFMRRLLRQALETAGLHVVGEAVDGDEALALCRRHRPEVLTLDLAMPGRDGIGVLQALRSTDLPTVVVVVSAFSPAHGARAVDALAEGAFDLVVKPQIGSSAAVFLSEIGTKAHSAAHASRRGRPAVRSARASTPTAAPSADGTADRTADGTAYASADGTAYAAADRTAYASADRTAYAAADRTAYAAADRTAYAAADRTAYAAADGTAYAAADAAAGGADDHAAGSRRRPPLVVIACSTGGPRALGELLPRLPSPLGAGTLLVQHMPPGFTAALAARLDKRSALHVREASTGDVVARGDVLIAPGGSHMHLLAGGRVRLAADEDPVGGLRPRADLTILDAAEHFGRRLLLVVLTGMGRDGLVGAHAVRKAGGRILVEAESTCSVYGMPRAVSEASLADAELALHDLPQAIASACAA